MSESAQATQEVEMFLTEAHGAEVRGVIENFTTKWSSLEAHNDPSIQSDLATEPFLSSAGYARLGEALYSRSSWLVTKSAVVESVRVLGYSPERFKAVACVTELVDKIMTDGVFIESLPPQENRIVYVFVREDDTWKLSGAFNVTYSEDTWRDWQYVSEQLKETIGDLPDWELCHK
jgi:hypothetical protein